MSPHAPAPAALSAPAGLAARPGITLSADWQMQDVLQAPESGEVVSRPDFAPVNWYPAAVPGTVLTTLVHNGVYPEPLYGQNNRLIPESLCRTSYWYRTVFTVPPDFAGKHIWLNFEGINYMAEVWVNGRAAGAIKGAFIRGTFDITQLVEPGQAAAVAVRILPPLHPGTHPDKTLAAGTGPNGGELSSDGPTFVCSIGWDWMPTIRDRNMGIWQKVTLSATGPVVIVPPPFVTSQLPRPDAADLTLETTLRNVTDRAQTGTLRGCIGAIQFTVPITLCARETRLLKLTPADVPQLHLENPQLWWPNTYGRPHLYPLDLRFDIDGQASDATHIDFGIRTITYQIASSPDLALCVNGVPVIAKGGNWGLDEAMKRIPRARLEAQIRMHQIANCNMIRNWVGQSTGEDFYDLCDRYGLLVWDEFFEPNACDGPQPLNVDVELYLANVRDKVLRFRHHACIALWCGRNESDPEPEAVDLGIQAITAELDPSRTYHRNSDAGRGVKSGGPYCWRAPHRFYQFPEAEAFKTELGSVSVPTLEAVQAMMPREDWETINDDWAVHDLCRGAQEGRDDPTLYLDAIDRRYGPRRNLADLVRKAQLANYEAYRAMYEGRFAKLFHPVTGVITWMSNPAQPSFVWQLYSHDLEPNAALFAVRKACEPLHIQMNQDNFHLTAVNASAQPLVGGQAHVEIYRFDGTRQAQNQRSVHAPAHAATDLGAIDFPKSLSPIHFIKLAWYDAGRLVSENFYWRALPEHAEDFTALDKLPPVALNAEVTRRDHAGLCTFQVVLSNPTAHIALMAHLQLRRSQSQRRILPVYYSDNYTSLLPGESRTIAIEAAATNLQGEIPVVILDGWNVTVVPQSFPGVAIASNPSYARQ
jgi:beta-mannosidase